MTVYIKYENEKLITAPNKPIEDLIAEGYKESTEDFVAKYYYKENLQAQINELDIKRIRAIVEPSKKTETQTWLEYYTEQIVELRTRISELEC